MTIKQNHEQIIQYLQNFQTIQKQNQNLFQEYKSVQNQLRTEKLNHIDEMIQLNQKWRQRMNLS